MRLLGIATVVTGVSVSVAACGSGGRFVAATPSPTPVNLSVSINNSRVQLSPTRVGAGPVLILVTNQASRSETLTVHPSRGGLVATTGPINPDTTAQVQVNLTTPGDYALRAERAAPARLRIGAPRGGADNALLQP